MHTFFKKLLVTLAVIFSVTATLSFIAPAPTYARSLGQCGADDYLLGMTPWDCGIQNFDSEEHLITNIAIIAANVLTDLSVIAAYLVIGYVIYGGYLYMFSNGDAGKVASGKKTLTHAFIGLAIVLLSSVIFNTIRIALLGSGGSFTSDCTSGACVDQIALVTNLIQWFIGSAGVIALAFIFIGGISYMTSSGDAGKLQKAKNTITYAIIGLAIVALSFAITGFVSSLIRGAATDSDDGTGYVEQLTIAKEYHEN